MKIYRDSFQHIVSPENLFHAWDVFREDKRKKKDVMSFEWRLEENIFRLSRELRDKAYRHGTYEAFSIADPKQRRIHKASVRDRILHHAIFSIMHPMFEETFIATSFSCRVGFGNHKGVEMLGRMTRAVSRNNTRPCFVLKCDVRKFFDSINHSIVKSILARRILDRDARWLMEEIIESFHHPYDRTRERERERERMPWRRHSHRQSYIPAFRECIYERV